jgi:hypothetical protein
VSSIQSCELRRAPPAQPPPARAGPDMSVADAQAVIDEAMAFLDEERRGLIEISADIREEGGAHGYALAQIVAPYVCKATCRRLFAPAAEAFWYPGITWRIGEDAPGIKGTDNARA